MKNELTLRKLKNTAFPALYRCFMVNDTFANSDRAKILAVAAYLINLNDDILNQLGYRVIVEYCNQTQNYHALYDVAVNQGLYPISKFIEEHYALDGNRNFFTEWNDCFTEQFKQGDAYFTEEQKTLNTFFQNSSEESIAVVAPTSYGKSELIIEAVKEYADKRICIITPTKALLMQTKQRIRLSGVISKTKKIIVHPEMYNTNEDSCIAVLTQERLLRLLKKDDAITFDCIIVDEAHELLEENTRSNTLASVIIVATKRNPSIVLKFLTPFVADSSNLQPRYTTYDLKTFRISEYIKTEKFFFHDLKKGQGSYLYDQFFNDFYSLDCGVRDKGYEEQIVQSLAGRKNIIYLNKPRDIERFALALAELLPNISDPEIDNACTHIGQYMQPQYNLLRCLRKGIIYHHGSVPDAIRIYIERLYKTLPTIKYVVTSSTLLSGINLPAEKMFILDGKKGKGNLSLESFRNLIGRVCRFSEIFNRDTGNLCMLEPEIHVVFGSYFSKNANGMEFLRRVAKVEAVLEDSVQNVLLTNTKIDDGNVAHLKEAQEFIENYEPGIIKDYDNRYTQTNIGKACILNGVREIDVFTEEGKMQAVADTYITKGKINNTDDLLEAIVKIFISKVSATASGADKLSRLERSEAQKFYSMLLEWRVSNKSYAEMIMLFVGYWRTLLQADRNAIIFVGRWGDLDAFGSHNTPYTMLAGKTRSQIINLAIVRIKEEQDFIDNNIIRFVEILNDLDMLEEQFYKKIKYGTADDEIICMLKNGLSLSLSKLLKDNYRQYVDINISRSTVIFSDDLLAAMAKNEENNILIYEVENCM